MGLDTCSKTCPDRDFVPPRPPWTAPTALLILFESSPILFVCALFITYGWVKARYVHKMRRVSLSPHAASTVTGAPGMIEPRRGLVKVRGIRHGPRYHPSGVHAHRTARRHRHHRRPHRSVAAGGPEGPRGRVPGEVHQQPQADGSGTAQLPRRQLNLSAWSRGDERSRQRPDLRRLQPADRAVELASPQLDVARPAVHRT